MLKLKFAVNRLFLKAVNFLLLFAFIVLQMNSAQAEDAEWRYSVRPGDNLIQFAQKYLLNSDDWRTLQTLNHIQNPKRMPLGLVLRVPLGLMKQLPASAEVVLTTGKAGILKTDDSVQSVAIGQQLGAGTILFTGDNSKLNIKLADGSIVSMQPNSTMKLDTLSMYSGGGMVDTKLRLQQGKLETEANPAHVKGNSMQIITPTAVAAVRGTKFRVSTDNTSIRQETLEGKVGLIAAGEEVGVAKGYGSLSEGGNAPLPPVLLLPAPATQGLANTLDKLPVVFNMAAQEGAVAWLAKVSPNAQFSVIAATDQTDPAGQGNSLRFSDLADGHYYLKVRAKDGKGLEGYDAMHEFTLHARPFAPVANAPANNAVVRNTKPQLAWATIEQAKSYQLQLAQNADFKQLIENRQLADAKFTLEKDLPPGQYFWRLASIDGDSQGPYSAADTFTVKPLPPAPDIRQLTVKVLNNAVFVHTISPPEGLHYDAILHNERNQQKNVWLGQNLGVDFDFLLKEYGKQTLVLRHVEADGTAGPDSIVEFDAPPP